MLNNIKNVRRSGIRIQRAALLISTILASGAAVPALAQNAPAPETHRNADEHGVDLSTGTFNMALPEGGIGPSEGGVHMVRYLGQSGYRDNWSGELYRLNENGTEVATIVFGTISEKFTKTGSAWVNNKANGGTLTEDQTDLEFTYTARSGATIKYKSPKLIGISSGLGPQTVPQCDTAGASACGLPTEITRPDGNNYQLTWNVPEQCTFSGGGFPGGGGGFPGGGGGGGGLGGGATCTKTYRLQDVRSSSSYAMKIKYKSDVDEIGNGGLPSSDWFIRDTLKFIDLSESYCDKNALNCDSIAGSWPTVSYNHINAVTVEITNENNETWRIEDNPNADTRVRRPGQSVDSTIVTRTNAKVTSVTQNGETRNYSWSTSGANVVVNTTDGDGSTGEITNMPIATVQRPVTAEDGLSNTTSYIYDANGRVTSETRPEGDKSEFTYDARGNLLTTRIKAKPGSSLTDIVITSSYDASCGNIVKCNKPNWSRDARSNQTDFTYDTVSGELTKVRLPAAASGQPRAEINYVYSSLFAKEKNASGNLVNAANPQQKLTQITSCSSAATCLGTANETKITVEYNNSNLLPTKVTTAAGNGSITATVKYAYDDRDNLVSTDGPLSGTADTVTYYLRCAG
ncbi:MAG: hypothetical protein V3V15_03985 [Sphingorhabdus sp.]